MKTLFNKITKNIVLPLAVAGMFSFNSYSQTTELEKYNLENKQLHEDFMKFCRENPNKKVNVPSHYLIEFPNKEYSVDFRTSEDYLHVGADTNFYDENNEAGLNPRDSYSAHDELNFRISHRIEDLPPEEQLLVAKQYTALKRKILHDEKWGKY